jgi:hypothetical protein
MYAQNPDSLQPSGRETIGIQLEHLEDEIDAGTDISELSDDLEYFLEHPLNLNTATKSDLQRLGILTDTQIKNLVDYRVKYGCFNSIYELKSIDGMGRNSIEAIMPFVVTEPQDKTPSNPIRLFSGKHDLLLRFQRKLVSTAGYVMPVDSLQPLKAGSFYLGDPNRYYIRYTYKLPNKLSLGFLAEKDPGEAFFRWPTGLNDSLRNMLPRQGGFDFYSFHLGIENLGVIKSLVIGDFHLRFGQGLTIWTGLSFSGNTSPAGIKRYARGISPNTSVNEGLFMRGAAIAVQWKKTVLNLFYSRKNTDANIINSDADISPAVSSLPTGGYHRSVNELLDKNTLVTQHFGGHINFSFERFRLGASAYKSIFNMALDPGDGASRLYQHRGKENIAAGLDFDILFRKTNIFGEIACSINGGWAGLAGLTHTTANGSIFSVVYREYNKQYQNLLANASGKRDGNTNERGINMAIEVPLFRSFILLASADHHTYPWLTSRTINTYRGQDYLLSMAYRASRNAELSFRFKYTHAEQKSSDDVQWFDGLEMLDKYNLQFVARYLVSPSFSFKSQAGYALLKGAMTGAGSSGSLLLQDVYFHPALVPVKLTFRYALFNTDDYQSRLYAYEHDVLYASSMPAYYGIGFRYYFLIKYSPAAWVDAWLRFSMTHYTDRDMIGSGADEIAGNKVPEIKVQLRLKL